MRGKLCGKLELNELIAGVFDHELGFEGDELCESCMYHCIMTLIIATPALEVLYKYNFPHPPKPKLVKEIVRI